MWFEVPEEIRKQLEENQQRAEMAADSYRHDVTRLFNELTQDQLMTVRNILHQLVFDEDGKLAAYYEGQVASALNFVHNVCPSCGVDHEQEAASFGDAKPNEYFDGNVDADATYTWSGAETTSTDDEDKLQPMLPLFELSDEEIESMKNYHLDDVRDADTHQILWFACTGVNGLGPCGMTYPSIEDRMRRPADSCTGCQQKAAWG